MANGLIFHITKAAPTEDAAGKRLVLRITPTVPNGSPPSPYTVEVEIPDPSDAQKAGYTFGKTITLTPDIA